MFSRFNSNKWYDVLQYAHHLLLIRYPCAQVGRPADCVIKLLTLSKLMTLSCSCLQ